MITTELYSCIIALIKSDSLKKTLSETGYKVSELDLLRVVYSCAEAFDERIAIMRELAEQADGGEVRELAKLTVTCELSERERFERSEEDSVYELHVKPTPDSYDERYLCASLELAYATAERFYREYDCVDEETELTEYSVEKRNVRRSVNVEPFEDYRGSATYTKGMVLSRVWQTEPEDCVLDIDCEDCLRACATRVRSILPRFPSFAANGECVGIISPGKVRRAVRLKCDDDDESSIGEYYVIPLDVCIEGDTIDTFNGHEHIPITQCERLSDAVLTEKERETAELLRKMI